jgi:hypothetical protein
MLQRYIARIKLIHIKGILSKGDSMTNEEKLDFKKKYENNPVQFVEDFYNVKLLPYQKILLNCMLGLDKTKQYFFSRINTKKFIGEAAIEYSKKMKMDFQVWKPNGIEVYEKGELVRTVEYKGMRNQKSMK